ncbi:LacI family DNA-binding transcriptional regulator [Asticcacaulis sp. AND118]|uniref:LacI family DNA-binding transcriptional regulator n=1 Tax=Asticcacaulis sp. AND118 TaxID=2840468 RepID=UPI001CFFC505|nr:LacI family DNA-binding transcriptional regulator [Asticcacaulis sp. AND118]UDF05270.1 LacI family transcriptional regulator [Asticcacaulis sp. AND118]
MADESRPVKRITLKDVAKAADVSLASASYAINGTGSLGSEVRAHILKIAADLGYRQNLSARAVRTGRTGTLGLILPDFANPFFTGLAQAVMRRARADRHYVVIADTEGDVRLEQQAIASLIERGVDGLVWFPVRDLDTATPPPELPTVIMDRRAVGLSLILADYTGGGRQAAAHLMARGHRKVGIVSGPMSLNSMTERCQGFRSGLSADAECVFHVETGFSDDLEPAVGAAIDNRSVTAIFAGTDQIALAVVRRAARSGLRVPEDLSIIGFGDAPWVGTSAPALTTVEMPIEDMANEAVDRLLQRDPGAPARVVFDTSLIVRESTRALP